MFMAACACRADPRSLQGDRVRAVVDLMAGRIQMMFDAAAAQISGLQTGQLRPLAVMSAERLGLLS